MYKCIFKITSLLFLLNNLQVNSQNKSENDLYISSDREFSHGNSSLNNGKFHINNDVTANNEHRYLFENKFYIGEIKFEDQVYFGNKIKYDILKDELILNPENLSEKIAIVLDKNKVDHFTIQKKKFVKLQVPKSTQTEYYEENLISKDFVFYVKYTKFTKEKILDKGVYATYFDETKYLVKISNAFKEIKSKKDLLLLFPQFKTQIKEYYRIYDSLEEENKIKFMENLMSTIKKLSNN